MPLPTARTRKRPPMPARPGRLSDQPYRGPTPTLGALLGAGPLDRPALFLEDDVDAVELAAEGQELVVRHRRQLRVGGLTLDAGLPWRIGALGARCPPRSCSGSSPGLVPRPASSARGAHALAPPRASAPRPASSARGAHALAPPRASDLAASLLCAVRPSPHCVVRVLAPHRRLAVLMPLAPPRASEMAASLLCAVRPSPHRVRRRRLAPHCWLAVLMRSLLPGPPETAASLLCAVRPSPHCVVRRLAPHRRLCGAHALAPPRASEMAASLLCAVPSLTALRRSGGLAPHRRLAVLMTRAPIHIAMPIMATIPPIQMNMPSVVGPKPPRP